MNIPKGIVNPFSEAFEPTWELWKAYKWETFNFKYKGVISEQMALKHLVDLSEGLEEKAVKIVNQSIRREWRGFFPLNETTTPNGKSRKKQPASGQSKAGDDSFRSDVLSELNKRAGNKQSEGGGSHLKAV